MLTDLREKELWDYRSEASVPEDFDEFWDRTMTLTRRYPLEVRRDLVDGPFETLATWDVTFNGFGGAPIRAWLTAPTGAKRLPTVVQYVGYGGGRGVPIEHSLWASIGFAHLIMDTRGQGAAWCRGNTADPGVDMSGSLGFLNRGIDSAETYYYRRVFSDAVRALEAVRTFDIVDPDRVAVLGGSQGGGIALAASGLAPELIAATVAFVPFLCDFPRAISITDNPPYVEIADLLRVQRDKHADVLATLSYFDGVALGSRASSPAYFSAGLMDPTCPPSTVFGAFHAYGGPKGMTVWPFGGHEGGGCDDTLRAIEFLRRAIGS